jgi:NitT/TauT family transport system substrate-binding protein
MQRVAERSDRGNVSGGDRGWVGWVIAALMALAWMACAGPTGQDRAPAAAAAAPGGAAAGVSGAAAGAASLVPVKLVVGTINISTTPFVLAQEKGFAARHGIELEVIAARGGAEAMAALLSQDAPIGSLSGNAVVNAVAGGADLVVFAVNQPRLTYQIMSAPEVKVPTDLRGRRLGVADVGGNSDLAAQIFLDKFGMRRGEDVVVLALGSQPERLGGLQAGAVQGAMLNAPFTGAARKIGYNVLFDYGEDDYEIMSSGLVTTRGYLEAQPQTVRGLVAALVDAIHYYKTQPEDTVTIIGRFLQQDDPDVLAELYRESAGRALPETPYVSPAGLGNAIAQAALTNEAVGRLRPESLIDDRFVRELDDSGYVRALYGR